jgi:hypothetical protein
MFQTRFVSSGRRPDEQCLCGGLCAFSLVRRWVAPVESFAVALLRVSPDFENLPKGNVLPFFAIAAAYRVLK